MKARRDAEHVVCYKCHNSTSILKEPKAPASKTPVPYPQNLPNKAIRMSDMMRPDPMFFPGFYPNQIPMQQMQYKPTPQNQMQKYDIMNQFNDEFEQVMREYNMKLAKLQMMKMDLNKMPIQPVETKVKRNPSHKGNIFKELLEVVDDNRGAPASRRQNSFDYHMNKRYGEDILKGLGKNNFNSNGLNFNNNGNNNGYGNGNENGGNSNRFESGYRPNIQNSYNNGSYNNGNGFNNNFNNYNVGKGNLSNSKMNNDGLNKIKYDNFGGINIQDFVMGKR